MKVLRHNLLLQMFLTVWGPMLLLAGCASLHLGVKSKHSNDNTTVAKTVSAHSFDSLGSLYANQSAQMQQLQMMLEDKNVSTTSNDEDATTPLIGANKSSGHSGGLRGHRTSINQIVNIGRANASGTYYYDKDSIHVSLTIGDTIINIHRHITTTTDLSKIRSSLATTTNSTATTVNAVAVHADSNKQADTKVHNKHSSSVAVDATASIGGKGYVLAVIALVFGLIVGKFIFGQKK